MHSKVAAIIVAAGSGTRMGAGINKVLMPLLGRPVISYTLSAFEKCEEISEIIIVTSTNDIPTCKNIVTAQCFEKVTKIISGADKRQGSVLLGLLALNDDIKFVAIHDAARALINPFEIKEVIHQAMLYKAAALGVKSKDTLKAITEDGFISHTLNRELTYNIQTPQVFDKNLITNAHLNAKRLGIDVTDDCALIENEGVQIKIVEGSYENIKLTTPDDIYLAENILQKRRT